MSILQKRNEADRGMNTGSEKQLIYCDFGNIPRLAYLGKIKLMRLRERMKENKLIESLAVMVQQA
jgi:hypothetical protein